MGKARECCGWNVWFEMAGIDENGSRIVVPPTTVGPPTRAKTPTPAGLEDTTGEKPGS